MKSKQGTVSPLIKNIKRKGRSNEFDVYIGARIKFLRTSLNMTQGELAQKIGVTFQQLQKYEQGANRVSATRLHQISHVLNVNITTFFKEYEDKKQNKISVIDAFANDADLAKLFSYWTAIKDPALKKNLLSLLKSYMKDS